MIDYFRFIVVMLIIYTLIIVSYLLYRFSSSLNKEKRISRFAISGLTSNKLSIYEQIEIFYGKVIEHFSNGLKSLKIFNHLEKKYDYVVDVNSIVLKRGIDYISNKIMIGLLFCLITIITFSIKFKYVNLLEIVLSFLLGYFIPNIFIAIKKKNNRKQIENDLLKAVSIMNNAFKSGRSIMQAIDIVSKELDGAISNEFKKMYIDLSYGLDLEVVFKRFANRVNLDEVNYMTASLVILNKTGGNIVKVFNSIEKGFFERKKLNDELDSSLALSNLVYKILICLPILMYLAIYIISPSYFEVLFETAIGRIILVILIAIYILYIVIVKKITKLDEGNR